jgi:hypothetical protein
MNLFKQLQLGAENKHNFYKQVFYVLQEHGYLIY